MSDVVVIGAGMSGIACARALQAAGIPVRVIDKGRGIGGRVATRRAEVAGTPVSFDHGAQYLDQSEAAKDIAALDQDAVDIWHLGDNNTRIVGSPGMSAFPKALARGLDITLNCRVTTLTAHDALWKIETEAEEIQASHVAITVPAPQLAPILGETHPIVQKAASVVMNPCLTLMAAFDQDTPTPFVTRRDATAILSWIARNDTKPGRATAYQTWVAQENPDWSAAHIDEDRATVICQMVELLCDELGVDPSFLRHAGLQGWRYSFVEKPYGKPFISYGTMWAGGDWCCGPKIQDAWQSGSAIAADILRVLDKTASTGPVSEADSR